MITKILHYATICVRQIGEIAPDVVKLIAISLNFDYAAKFVRVQREFFAYVSIGMEVFAFDVKHLNFPFLALN